MTSVTQALQFIQLFVNPSAAANANVFRAEQFHVFAKQ